MSESRKMGYDRAGLCVGTAVAFHVTAAWYRRRFSVAVDNLAFSASVADAV